MKSAAIEPRDLQKRTDKRRADGEDQAAVAHCERRDLLTPAVERATERVRVIDQIRRLKDDFEVLRLPEDFIGKHERVLVPADFWHASRALVRNDAHEQALQIVRGLADRHELKAMVNEFA